MCGQRIRPACDRDRQPRPIQCRANWQIRERDCCPSRQRPQRPRAMGAPRLLLQPASCPDDPHPLTFSHLSTTTPGSDWRPPAEYIHEHVLRQTVTKVANYLRVNSASKAYSAARDAGSGSCRPAATASSRNDLTAASESSAAVLVPSAGSFLRTSAGAVMIWQPMASASTTLNTSRVEAQIISTLRVLRARAIASCMIGR